MFHSHLQRAGQEGLNVVRYSLLDDGRTLHAEERYRSRELDYDNVWVLARVEATPCGP